MVKTAGLRGEVVITKKDFQEKKSSPKNPVLWRGVKGLNKKTLIVIIVILTISVTGTAVFYTLFTKNSTLAPKGTLFSGQMYLA